MEHPVAASYLIMFGIGWHTYNCIFLSMYMKRYRNNSLKIDWSVILFWTNKHNIVRQLFIFVNIYRFLYGTGERMTISTIVLPRSMWFSTYIVYIHWFLIAIFWTGFLSRSKQSHGILLCKFFSLSILASLVILSFDIFIVLCSLSFWLQFIGKTIKVDIWYTVPYLFTLVWIIEDDIPTNNRQTCRYN